MVILLLLLGAFTAAAVSGAAGFGGALLLLPLLEWAAGEKLAVPLLTLAQLVGNASRMGFGVGHVQWRAVGYFLIGAVPMSVIGARSFVTLSEEWVIRLTGAAILVFVGLRSRGWFRAAPGPRGLAIVGAVVGLVSGLVGSAGPLGAAAFHAINLPPLSYVATDAAAAIVVHGVKTVVYGRYISLSPEFWALAAALGAAMVAGTYASKRIIERMPRERFRRFVTAALVGIGVFMVVSG